MLLSPPTNTSRELREGGQIEEDHATISTDNMDIEQKFETLRLQTVESDNQKKIERWAREEAKLRVKVADRI